MHSSDEKTTVHPEKNGEIEPMVNADAVGAVLGLTGRSVINHYHDKLFPGYRIGKSIRFRISEVLRSLGA
jgi:hypothetical protein